MVEVAWPGRSKWAPTDMRMEGGDPDAPMHKRQRLDSGATYNGLAPISQPPHSRPPQASSPPPARHYPPHSLPPPSQQSYPAQAQAAPGPYQPHQASPSLPPSDIRAYSDPRNIPSQGHRAHGNHVNLPARTSAVAQDSISDYSRPTAAPRPSAQDSQPSRSASVDAKLTPGMEHGGHQSPWPNSDHRPASFSNGYAPQPPIVSPPHPHEQQFQPPSLPPGQHFPQSVGPYTPAPYMGGPAVQYQGQQMRRKQVRATQACNHCRARKQKCDEARPCQFCRENNFDCQYKDVPPPKQDRSMMQLQESMMQQQESMMQQQESINMMQVTLQEIASSISSFSSWKQHVENQLPPAAKTDEHTAGPSQQPSPEQAFSLRASVSEQSGSRLPTPVQGRAQSQRLNSMKTESPTVAHSTVSPIAAHAATPIKQEAVLAAPQPPATPAESVRTDHTAPAEPLVKETSGLQGDHTTPAHVLLKDWKSMEHFTDGVQSIVSLLKQGYNVEDYPMQLEQDRGLVRVWGVGEGVDLNDGAQGPASPDSNESDASSPAPGKDGLWGPVLADVSSPSTLSANTSNHSIAPYGGLDYSGRLKLDLETVMRLQDSYLLHIHNMHPFLNPSKLKKMVKEFIVMYSPDGNRSSLSPTSAVPSHLAGNKRKRSGSSFLDAYSPGREKSNEPYIEKSLRNAIVLLVLALGKVCEYKDPLPAPQSDKNTATAQLHPAHDSPTSANYSFSSDDGTESRPRNIDNLPGMAYFSHATDILGNQQGGNTVGHAQAMLLAALYLGQYARVLESWSWINNACRVCLLLIKRDMDKISRNAFFNSRQVPTITHKENYRLNLVKCVYWTCLQLETDILAEMSVLPPSEISKYQEQISYPSGVFEKLPEDLSYQDSTDHERTMWIYSSQIHLRVILNEAHNTLYGAGGRNKLPGIESQNDRISKAARVHADILVAWRKLLPAELSWEDDDPPSTDLNIARLRAKFYGGLYVILRPYVDIAIHSTEFPPGAPTSSAWSQHSSPAATESVTTPSQSYQRSLMDLNSTQKTILSVAETCIRSAIQSTIAFDRVGADPGTRYQQYVDIPERRLVLPNIFGTLHAQFGNMLVLAAVYKSQRLRECIQGKTGLDQNTLALLFVRTLKMLHQVKPNSPILSVDYDILENVRRNIGIPVLPLD